MSAIAEPPECTVSPPENPDALARDTQALRTSWVTDRRQFGSIGFTKQSDFEQGPPSPIRSVIVWQVALAVKPRVACLLGGAVMQRLQHCRKSQHWRMSQNEMGSGRADLLSIPAVAMWLGRFVRI